MALLRANFKQQYQKINPGQRAPEEQQRRRQEQPVGGGNNPPQQGFIERVSAALSAVLVN